MSNRRGLVKIVEPVEEESEDRQNAREFHRRPLFSHMSNRRGLVKIVEPVEEESEDRQNAREFHRRPLGIGKWLSITRTPGYLKTQPGNDVISEADLVKHNTPDDIWMALPQSGRLSVFDVTKFSQYHPGGMDILLQHAGTDATEAYRLAHSYVSVDMVANCRRGFLRKSRLGEARLPNQLTTAMIPPRPIQPDRRKPNWNWTELDTGSVELHIDYPQFNPLGVALIHEDRLRVLAIWHPRVPQNGASRTNAGTLLVRTLLDGAYHRLRIRLLPRWTACVSSLNLTIAPSTTVPDVDGRNDPKHGRVRVSLRLDPSEINAGDSTVETVKKPVGCLGSVLSDDLTSVREMDASTGEFSEAALIDCRVMESKRWSESRYSFLRLGWPLDFACMPIPIGHHVMLRLKDDNDNWVARPYTPVCDDLSFSSEDDSEAQPDCGICLLVKIYPDGQLSPLIDRLKVGDSVQISLPMGQTRHNLLRSYSVQPTPTPPLTTAGSSMESAQPVAIFMLAAGSGITPMLRIMQRFLSPTFTNQNLLSIHVICFDRTEVDQVLTEEFDALQRRHINRLSVLRVLSESTTGGNSGRISEIICRQGLLTLQLQGYEPLDLHSNARVLWLICGPLGFNQTAHTIATDWGARETNIVQFKG